MNNCCWCGGKLVRGEYHPACATPARIWRHRGYTEDYVPDNEGVLALLTAFWGGAEGNLDGSVRGDLRKGDWSVLRWILGWDDSRGADFAWWCATSGVEEADIAPRLLAEWRPIVHAPCRRCGHGYDRHTFQFPSHDLCAYCRRGQHYREKQARERRA